MPEQFIKVKRSENPSTTILFNDTIIKNQDSTKLGSGSDVSNSNGDICRICHCESDIGNPLLSPCYCAGSLKYVHQTCLQQWLAASDTRSCELCKFNFILHTKIKPIGEWRRLEMSSVERRRLLCAILFHFVAAICVVWSLFVLIDRAAEEVQKGMIAWPFWTKLVVVAVGFTGGAVFMYIQCRQYLHLFSRWKAHNRIILVQNAPEKAVQVPSPNFTITVTPNSGRNDHPTSRVVASIECVDRVSPPFGGVASKNDERPSHLSTMHKSDTDLYGKRHCDERQESLNSCDQMELNIEVILGLEVDHCARKASSSHLGHTSSKTEADKVPTRAVFKSLPNLSASSENLLM